jgi:hypothetical protein
MVTERITTTNGSPSVEVHILCCSGDFTRAIWALKSFYHYSGARYPLVIHLQGAAYGDALAMLQEHFPSARVITQPEADAVVETWLLKHGLRRLLQARRKLYTIMKATDLHVMSQAVNLLYFDSDVLFFQKPSELLVAGPRPLPKRIFQRDCYNSYSITPESALSDLGISLAPYVNAGIMLFARESMDLMEYDRYLAHPQLARHHYHTEQTLHALHASARKMVVYLPDTYLLSTDPCPNPERLIARHYASPIRSLLAEEGITRLKEAGFLRALRG